MHKDGPLEFVEFKLPKVSVMLNTKWNLESIAYLVVVQVALHKFLQHIECNSEPVRTHVADSLVLRSAINAEVGGFLSESLLSPVKSPLKEIVCDLNINKILSANYMELVVMVNVGQNRWQKMCNAVTLLCQNELILASCSAT